jgi:hypothetical protein
VPSPASTTIPSIITITSKLWQSDHSHHAGGVLDGVVHGMEQTGDQHAETGAVVKSASDQSAAQMRAQKGPAPAPWSMHDILISTR